MEQRDLPQFLIALLETAEVLNAELSATKQGGYWKVLQHLPLDAFQAACVQIMGEEVYFPAPIIFKERARAWRAQQQALTPGKTAQELLALRDALVPPEEIKALIAGVWKEWGNGAQEGAVD